MDIRIAAQEFYSYSTYIRNYAPTTIKRFRQVISYYTRYAAIETFDQITDASVQALFMHGRKERRWAPKTCLCFKISLSIFFTWCIQRGYMECNYAALLESPRVPQRIPPKLSKQEALRLLSVVENYPYKYTFQKFRNHTLFATCIFAGLRLSELLHLTVGDVDLENCAIYVRHGKGKKDRVVPMSYPLAQILKRYTEERKRLKKTCPQFFASLNRNKGFTETGMKYLVQLIRKASGISFTTHKLRHTFATLMLEGGCDIYSLSKMMGHADITTTTIYLAASPEHLRAQMMKHPLGTL